MKPEWIELEGGTADGQVLAIPAHRDVVYMPHLKPAPIVRPVDDLPESVPIYRDEYERCHGICGTAMPVFHYKRTLS